MANRGFGVAASIPSEFVAPLASAAEEAGYTTFWVNDTPGADGLAALESAGRSSTSIRLGVGVIPLDRRGPSEIVSAVSGSEFESRFVLGIGAGGTFHGSLTLVKKGVEAIRAGTSAPIAIGALGPRMIALADQLADGVILNWLTPEWIMTSTQSLTQSSSTERIGYIRTALTESRDALGAEANRYTGIPQYARHFTRMGTPAFDTCAFGSASDIAAKLAAFDAVLDETVVRAITADQSLKGYMAVLEAGRPSKS